MRFVRSGARDKILCRFVLVEDVAQALVSALDVLGSRAESFNLVADSRLSALDYLHALEECTGSEFQKIPTPPWRFYVIDVMKWMVKRAIRHPDRRRPSYRDWETRTQRAHYDCSKARKLLNWNPTSLQTKIVTPGNPTASSGATCLNVRQDEPIYGVIGEHPTAFEH